MDKNVSLETAKRLKEAGWPQLNKECYKHFHKDCEFCPEYSCAAPDATELLEALPMHIHLYKTVGTYGVHDEINGIRQHNPNPAEALASLWLELKAKNLLTPSPAGTKE